MATREPWQELHDYWVSKGRNGRPPAYKDLDPLFEIPRLVPNLVLLEPVEGSYRYRLVGSDVESRFGTGLTGKLIGMPITHPKMRDYWRDALDFASTKQQARLYRSIMPAGVVGNSMTLVLPLVAEHGATELIMAGLFLRGFIAPGKLITSWVPVDL